MKRFLICTIIALTATLARADGDPLDKYGPLDRYDGSPALKSPKKEPKVYADPAPKKEHVLRMPPLVVSAPVPKDPPSESLPWKFWAGPSLFAGTDSYIGGRFDVGWFPRFMGDRFSLNAGIGGVHVSDRNPGPAPDYELNRGYVRGSVLYWSSWKKLEFPIGVFHDRGLNTKVENTYRRTGGTIGVFYKKFGVSLDYAYNAVEMGYTPKGFGPALNVTWKIF